MALGKDDEARDIERQRAISEETESSPASLHTKASDEEASSRLSESSLPNAIGSI